MTTDAKRSDQGGYSTPGSIGQEESLSDAELFAGALRTAAQDQAGLLDEAVDALFSRHQQVVGAAIGEAQQAYELFGADVDRESVAAYCRGRMKEYLTKAARADAETGSGAVVWTIGDFSAWVRHHIRSRWFAGYLAENQIRYLRIDRYKLSDAVEERELFNRAIQAAADGNYLTRNEAAEALLARYERQLRSHARGLICFHKLYFLEEDDILQHFKCAVIAGIDRRAARAFGPELVDEHFIFGSYLLGVIADKQSKTLLDRSMKWLKMVAPAEDGEANDALIDRQALRLADVQCKQPGSDPHLASFDRFDKIPGMLERTLSSFRRRNPQHTICACYRLYLRVSPQAIPALLRGRTTGQALECLIHNAVRRRMIAADAPGVLALRRHLLKKGLYDEVIGREIDRSLKDWVSRAKNDLTETMERTDERKSV